MAGRLRARARPGGSTARVRDLHLGLDRAAQGCRDAVPRADEHAAQPPGGDLRADGRRGRRPGADHRAHGDFSFDMSWEELLWLVEGHHVHVADEELRRDGRALVAYCAAHRVDVVNLTPTYAQAAARRGAAGRRPPARAWCCSAARRSPRSSGPCCATPRAWPATTSTARPSTRSTPWAAVRRQRHRHRRHGRSGTPPATSWTAGCGRSRRASRVSSTSPAPGWPAAT